MPEKLESAFMKNLKIVPSKILTALALVAGLNATQAVQTSWLQTSGSASWNAPGSWSNGVPVISGTADLTAALTATATATLTTTGTVGILNISSGNTFNMALNSAAGASLVMDNGGAAAQINIGTVGNTNNTVIDKVPISMTAGGLVISGSFASARVITGTISSAAAGLNTLTLKNFGGGNLTVNSTITNGAGTVRVLVDAASLLGIVSLGGSNSTFSGGIVLRNGLLGGTNLGAGAVTLGDAGTTGNIALVNGSGAISNNIVISSLVPQSTQIAFKASLNNTMTYSGNVDLQRLASVWVSSGSTNIVYSGTISGQGGLETLNTGGNNSRTTVGLSGNNSFAGGVVLNDRTTLNLGHASALGSGTLTVTGTAIIIDSTQSNLTLSTNNNIALNNNITYAGTGGNSLNVGTGTVTFSGNKTITVSDGILTIGGMIIGGNNLTKAGSGVLALNGANTYAGETDVTGGTLRGTGSVAGDVFVSGGAALEAGNSIGTFTVGGVADLSAGGTFRFELNSSLGTHDQLVANGVTLDDNALISFSDLGVGTWTVGNIIAINNTSGGAISGIFAGYAEGAGVVIGANSFTVTYLGGDGNDFALLSVPEPGAWLLVATGLGFTLLRRRRS